MAFPTVFAIFSMTLLLGVQSQICELGFKDCGSQLGKVNSVYFNSTCEGKEAILKHGLTVQLNISLVSNVVSSKLPTSVYGIIEGVPVPFPLPDSEKNACQVQGMKCPTTKNQLYNYLPTINVLKSYPKIRLVVKWEVKDDASGKYLICIEVPVEIQD